MRGPPTVRIGVRPVSISSSNAFSIAPNSSRRRDKRQPARASTSEPALEQEVVAVVVELLADQANVPAAVNAPTLDAHADRSARARHLRHALAVELTRR